MQCYPDTANSHVSETGRVIWVIFFHPSSVFLTIFNLIFIYLFIFNWKVIALQLCLILFLKTRIFSNEVKDSEIRLLIISESASLPWHQITVANAEKQWMNEDCDLDPDSLTLNQMTVFFFNIFKQDAAV